MDRQRIAPVYMTPHQFDTVNNMVTRQSQVDKQQPDISSTSDKPPVNGKQTDKNNTPSTQKNDEVNAYAFESKQNDIFQKITKIKTLDKNAQNDADLFPCLSFEDVQINLHFLTEIKEGEKVMIVDGQYMQVDQRYIQAIRRYYSDDSRIRTLKFIGHIINEAKRYCTKMVEDIYSGNSNDKQATLEELIKIQSLLYSAMAGLGRIASTYKYDTHNISTVATYQNSIKTFCDQDLKKVISK